MFELFLNIGIPIIKWLFSRKAKKKLTDKEFVDYILAHQKMRSRAGQASMEWEDALKEAQAELEKETNKE